MTPTRPNVDPIGLYGPVQASEVLGIHRSTLARYEKAGFIHARLRKVNGRKVYSGQQLIDLWKNVYL